MGDKGILTPLEIKSAYFDFLFASTGKHSERYGYSVSHTIEIKSRIEVAALSCGTIVVEYNTY